MTLSFVRRQYGWVSARLFRKYVLIIVSLVVGALLISGGLDIFFTYQDKLASISDSQRDKASIAAANIDFFIGDIQRQLQQAAHTEYDDGETGFASREKDYLALINRVPSITELGYWDSAGQLQFMMAQFGRESASYDSPMPVDQVLAAANTGGSFNGPIYFDDNLIQHTTMAIAEPGSGKGVLIAEVNLTVVQVIISQISLADFGLVYVVDSNGSIVAHPVDKYAKESANLSHLSQVKNAIDSNPDPSGHGSRDAVSIETSLEGESVLATSFPIESLGWYVLAEYPRSQILTSLQAPIIRSIVVLLLGLVMAVLTSLILARKMVSPILKLRDAVDRVGSGSTEEVDLKTGDELEALGQAFNHMSAQIRDAQATLEERVEQRTKELADANANYRSEIVEREKAERIASVLKRAIEHSPTAVLITDTEANIEYVNPKFTEVTGYTFEEAIGKKPSILQSGRTSREEYDRIWETIRAGGRWEGELYNKRKDGELYWSSEAIVPLKDEQGRITHFLALEEDITNRRKAEDEARLANQRLAEANLTLEQRVMDRTSDLQHSNDRLIEAHDQLVRTEKLAAIGQLAAGVAHDLRNPLGAIKNAVYYLNGKLHNIEAVLENPRILEFLQIIDEEVEHSNKIIGDLMDFARITTPTFSPADLGEMVQDSLSKIELDEGIYINIVDSHHEDLLQVQADGQQLHRVFQNLIINAQDAMPDGGVITVSTVETDGFAEVAISDTGDGIKPEIILRIFDPLFTTKTKGTGLGLAVCQQIVSKHGGTIVVESKLGEGATFKVRLPVSVLDSVPKEVLNATP